jgi:hypothetical protein
MNRNWRYSTAALHEETNIPLIEGVSKGFLIFNMSVLEIKSLDSLIKRYKKTLAQRSARFHSINKVLIICTQKRNRRCK